MPADDARYLPVALDSVEVSINSNATAAVVQGSLGFKAGVSPSRQIRLVAVAYDSAGHVAGLRTLDIVDPLLPGGSKDFSMNVYSLGPPIDRVETLVEAKP
jgi:hypothetical protein